MHGGDLRRKWKKNLLKKTMALAIKGKSKKGKPTYTGHKNNLKASQTYNGRFAREAGTQHHASWLRGRVACCFFDRATNIHYAPMQVARNFLLYSERHPNHNVLVDFTPDQWADARLFVYIYRQTCHINEISHAWAGWMASRPCSTPSCSRRQTPNVCCGCHEVFFRCLWVPP